MALRSAHERVGFDAAFPSRRLGADHQWGESPARGLMPTKTDRKHPTGPPAAPKVSPRRAQPAPPTRGVERRRRGPRRGPFFIAGVGASAGGLEAFTQLLQALPNDVGLAMVLVQHLAPQRDSALPTLLAARTSLPVVQAAEGMRVEPDVVYVIPPNAQMSIKGETLHLVTQPSDRTRYSPIDFFLHSLAESAQQSAIGIVLSGTGSDGTAGLREIKAVGGITIAQSPESAAYTGMPAAAVASGAVDLVLHPAAMGAELAAIVRHRLSELATVEQEALPSSKVKRASTEQHIEQIFRLLRAASGVDFRQYKRPTIDRRLQRRMLLHKLSGLDQYVQLLREQPAEVQALYDDILIRVTRFFRNPEVYAAFTDCMAPRLTHSPHTEEQPIRAWIPGCSTGEEAYCSRSRSSRDSPRRGAVHPCSSLRRISVISPSSAHEKAVIRTASRRTCRWSVCGVSFPRSTAAGTASTKPCATCVSSRATT